MFLAQNSLEYPRQEKFKINVEGFVFIFQVKKCLKVFDSLS